MPTTDPPPTDHPTTKETPMDTQRRTRTSREFAAAAASHANMAEPMDTQHTEPATPPTVFPVETYQITYRNGKTELVEAVSAAAPTSHKAYEVPRWTFYNRGLVLSIPDIEVRSVRRLDPSA